MKYILILISKLLMWVYSLPVFPLAFLFRKWARAHRGNPVAWLLWITLDDEYDYGEPWFLERNGYRETFLTAWLWSYIRNNSFNWNFYVVRYEPAGEEKVVKSWSTDQYPVLLHRRLKWEYQNSSGEWVGNWDTNQGSRLSQERTWVGTAYCVYRNGESGKKYWRFSHVSINRLLLINVKLGFNDRGETLFDVKVKRNKKSYTSHWKEKK